MPATGIRIATSGGGTRVIGVDVPRRALEVPLTPEMAPLARAPLVTPHSSPSHYFSASVSAHPQTRVLLVWLLLLSSLSRLYLLLRQAEAPFPLLLFMFLQSLMFLSLLCSLCLLDRRTGTLLGTGPWRCDSQRLWELDWLHLPSAVSTSQSATTTTSALVASSTTSFAQWHHRLGHLCGSRLSSLVGRGVLGSVSGNTSLHCMGYKLGKQL
uniref:Putative retrotransposon protein n=1 Tax=Phyllostachys edulis TaxID=38705 RepID=D3IVL7_PHYED|nr:putative retrotransposon protein [Phyllostachys edulis]